MLILCALTSPAMAALNAFVSVLPLAYLTERVGGERVAVEALVGPGRSPHAYEPSPRQIARLGEAVLFFRAGLPFEAGWMSRIGAVNPALRVVDVREGLPLLPLAEHEDEGHTHSNDPDPHVWTAPLLAIRIADTIRNALTQADPEGEATYSANFQRLSAELKDLDGEIRARLAGTDHRVFLVFHPAWGYFAEDYGLRQVAIERLGKDPGPRELAAIIDQARAEGVKTILVQPQMSRKAADAVAAAIGVKVVEVDPLAKDYPAALRRLTESLAETSR